MLNEDADARWQPRERIETVWWQIKAKSAADSSFVICSGLPLILTDEVIFVDFQFVWKKASVIMAKKVVSLVLYKISNWNYLPQPKTFQIMLNGMQI